MVKPIDASDLTHLIDAAIAMVSVHTGLDSMESAVNQISSKFPMVDINYLEAIWIGIAAKQYKELFGG